MWYTEGNAQRRDIMKRIFAFLLTIGVVLLLSSRFSPDPTGAHPYLQVTITPVAFDYLPLVLKSRPPTPTPTVTRTPAPCPQRAGTWRGTADFKVSSDRNTVTDFSFEVSACGSRWRLTADQLPISNDCKIAFAASSGSALLTGSGTFESETRIRGSWSLISTTCLGFGSWSSSWRSASNANIDTFDEGTEVHTNGTIVLEHVPSLE